VSFLECPGEHRSRETVDLNDDQSPPDSLRPAAATESADQAIEGALRAQKRMFQKLSVECRVVGLPFAA